MKNVINKILIPTDYSENAERAMKYGLKLASQLGAEVILFHGYHFLMTTSEDMLYITKMKDGEEKKLEKLRQEVQEDYPSLIVNSIIDYGSTVDLLASICKREKIDLIVMGTKGETNAVDAIFGSIASNTIKMVKCPTLIVPYAAVQFQMNEILFASDFHQTEDFDYLAPLFRILKFSDAAVSIVNVQEYIDFESAASLTEQKIGQLFDKYKHSHHYLESENVESALFDFAHLNSSDLIVLSTRHYSLWQRIWHKSMTKKLALHSTIPVLILHEN